MSRFVESLLVPAREGPAFEMDGHYDDARGYSVAVDGQPLIERPRSETTEITEVAGERDDPPPDDSDDSDEREGLEQELLRTYVEREEDEARAWFATILTRTDTSVDREKPDRDDWN